MAGQVMEATMPMHQQAAMFLGQHPQLNCKNYDQLAVMTTAATTPTTVTTPAAAEMAYLQQLQTAATAATATSTVEANTGGGGAALGEQCPRCASHDTKFCYYNNYNTSQPRHFCRACRRYWTLGGSLRNVPIGGSSRKRPRLAHHHHTTPPQRRQPAAHVVFGGGSAQQHSAPTPTPSSAQGFLGSLFALGAAPLLEGRAGTGTGTGTGFDLGLGLQMPGGAAGAFAGAGEFGAQVQGPGLRWLGGLWPAAGLLDNDNLDAWKVHGGAAVAGAGIWSPEFHAVAPTQAACGMLNGAAQLM